MEQVHVHHCQKVFLAKLLAEGVPAVSFLLVIERFVETLNLNVKLVSLEPEQSEELFD